MEYTGYNGTRSHMGRLGLLSFRKMQRMSLLKYSVVIWYSLALGIISFETAYGQVNYYIVNDTDIER